MKRILLAGLWLLALAASTSISAHEIRPGYLEVRQTEVDTYDITWRVPGRGDGRLMIHALLPENCTETTPIRSSRVPGAFIDQWTTACPDGLVGGTISIGGLAMTLTDVLVRIERLDGTLQTTRLTPDSASMVVVAAPTWQEVAATYLGLGIDHILSGVDHLLFVFALLLLVRSWKRLVATVTAFTVAHSITLAAATLGVVNVSQTPIEAIIALSIAVVAAELLRDDKQATATQRWCLRFRPAARLRLRRRADGDRASGTIDPARAAVFQCRRGNRAATVHLRLPGAGRARTTHQPVTATRTGSLARVWHRQCRRVLDD